MHAENDQTCQQGLGREQRCRAPDLRICRVLLPSGLAPWEIRSLLTARYRVFPEIPVSVTLIAINLQYGTPQALYQIPESPPTRGPHNLSIGDRCGTWPVDERLGQLMNWPGPSEQWVIIIRRSP